jgi:hypothetical protein
MAAQVAMVERVGRPVVTAEMEETVALRARTPPLPHWQTTLRPMRSLPAGLVDSPAFSVTADPLMAYLASPAMAEKRSRTATFRVPPVWYHRMRRPQEAMEAQHYHQAMDHS